MSGSTIEKVDSLYEEILNDIPAIVCDLDGKGKTLFVNDSVSDITGYSPEDLIGLNWWDVLFPGNQREQVDALLELLESGPVENHAMTLITKNGQARSIVWKFFRKSAHDEDLPNVRGFGLPMNEIKVPPPVRSTSSHEKFDSATSFGHFPLIDSERLRSVFDTATIGIAISDSTGHPLLVNPSLQRMLGYSMEELSQMTFDDLTHPDDRENETAFWNQLLAGEADRFQIEKRVIRKDGRAIWVRVMATSTDLPGDGAQVTIGVVEDITRHKEIEEARDRLAAIIEAAPDFVSFSDASGQILFLNRAGRNMLGLSADADISELRTQDPHPEWASRLIHQEGAPNAIREGIWRGETAIVNCEGMEIPVSQIVIAHKGPKGKIDFFSTIIRDISTQKNADNQLKVSEEKYREIVELTSDLIFISDKDGNQTFMNDAAYKILEITPDDIIGQQWIKLIHPDDHEKTFQKFQEMVQQGIDTFDFENRYVTSSGKIIYGLNNVRVIRNADGELVGVQGSAKDISERKLAEDALREALLESQRRGDEISVLLQSARSVLEQHDFRDAARSIYLSYKTLSGASAGFVEMSAVAGAEVRVLFFDPDFDLHPSIEEGSCPFMALRSEALNLGKAVLGNELTDCRLKSDSNPDSILLHNVLLTPMTIKGKVMGLIGLVNKPGGFTNDDLRIASAFGELAAIAFNNSQMIESLESSEERFRYVAQTASDAIISIDRDSNVIFWNREAESIYGYKATEVLGRPLEIIVPDRFKSNFRRGMQTLFSLMEPGSISHRLESPGVRKNGTEFIAEMSYTVWKSREGVFCTAVVRDITERKRLEEEILRVQRLETAGRIAGQVAHDFNNLLTPLAGYPELIKMDLPAGHPAVRLCDAMLKAVDQMSVINEDLMALGRRGHFNYERIDLNQIVQQAVGQATKRTNKAKVKLELTSDLLSIKGSTAQLLRVVLNLLTNAREAIQEKGTIAVRTENLYVEGYFERCPQLEMGEYVALHVSDSGHGIPPEIAAKVYDAFFTTKGGEKQRGAGLGLSVVQAIVGDHKGHVSFTSTAGKGTTFSVYFPVSREDMYPKHSKGTPEGKESILIVDDDDVQREVLGRLLGRLGYRVESAASGENALNYLNDHSPDLLILDMIMPGIDGTETYRRALQIHPKQKAMIISGFAESERVKEVQSLGAGAFVRKPVMMDTLAQAVRYELDREHQ